MKSTVLSVMILLMVNCNSNVEESAPCGQPSDEFFENIEGRVYRFTPEEQKWLGFEFYLGSRVDKIRGGGAIPCGNLPAEFRVDELDVVWSGFHGGTPSDSGDPHYRYVVLTAIEKAN